MSCHCLKHVGFALLLACASASAMAQNGRNTSANGEGACPQTPETTEAAAPKPGAKASAARAKYAPPATPAVRNGGGGEGDGTLPRNNAGKWHSFLPGMFR